MLLHAISPKLPLLGQGVDMRRALTMTVALLVSQMGLAETADAAVVIRSSGVLGFQDSIEFSLPYFDAPARHVMILRTSRSRASFPAAHPPLYFLVQGAAGVCETYLDKSDGYEIDYCEPFEILFDGEVRGIGTWSYRTEQFVDEFEDDTQYYRFEYWEWLDTVALHNERAWSVWYSFKWAVYSGAVPEPAAWGMMIAGFGLTGAGLRRRRAGRPTTERSAG